MPSVISLFDLTGTLAKPWLASHHVYQFDMQLEPSQGERITLINGTADTWKEQLDRLCREEEISSESQLQERGDGTGLHRA